MVGQAANAQTKWFTPAREASDLDLIVRDLAGQPAVELVVIVAATGDHEPDTLAWAKRGAAPLRWSSEFLARAAAAPEILIERANGGSPPGTSVVSAPLRLTHGSGALCAWVAASPPDPGDRLVWMVDSYARLAALSLDHGTLLTSLQAAGRRDALTGCLNYAALLNELVREVERSRRQGLALSCCFIDLDRYKAVNERFGHLRGNEVLKTVGAALWEAVRTSDVVGRYGGDEFVVLLPDTELDAAMALGRRLRSAIQAIPIVMEPDRLDASIGVAQWDSSREPQDLLADADRALMAAKSAAGGVMSLDGRGPPAGRRFRATRHGAPTQR